MSDPIVFFAHYCGCNSESAVNIDVRRGSRYVTVDLDAQNGNAPALDLTPEQAKKIAAALNKAADHVLKARAAAGGAASK